MNLFAVNRDLRVGSLVEVSGTAIRVELDGTLTELTRTYGGRVYAVGQFASVIKMHFGRTILFAYVRLLRMKSEMASAEGLPPVPPSEDARMLEADLFGEGVWDERSKTMRFSRGVQTYPLPSQAAYLMTQEELRSLFEAAEKSADGINPRVAIGTYIGADGALCCVNIDKMFGQHCAVLGSTGAGKSGTVAAIIHSVLSHCAKDDGSIMCPRIIIIDPHAEYSKAFGNRCAVYRAYNVPGEATSGDSKTLQLPYWLMSGEEFRDVLIAKSEYEATSENNIVHKALTHARLVGRGWIEPSKDWDGVSVTDGPAIPADPRPLKHEYEPLIASYDRDTPDPFTLEELEGHIRKEQGVRIKGKAWEAMSPSDYKSHASVLDKLSVLRADPRLRFMMDEWTEESPTLEAVIEQFVGTIPVAHEGSGEQIDIRIVDISGLPNEIAGPLTAAIARLLFQYKTWQTRAERERDPVLLVCEEAHRYVPDSGHAEYESAQKAVRRIAKEGRKYGIGLMLVSQRPSDVERTVLSQCNTWVVMRLTNTSDQEHVAHCLPDSVAGLAKLLPSLSRQEAIVVGEAAAIPARVKVRTLQKDQLPDSDDISFTKGWCEQPVCHDDIHAVVVRWRKESGE